MKIIIIIIFYKAWQYHFQVFPNSDFEYQTSHLPITIVLYISKLLSSFILQAPFSFMSWLFSMPLVQVIFRISLIQFSLSTNLSCLYNSFLLWQPLLFSEWSFISLCLYNTFSHSTLYLFLSLMLISLLFFRSLPTMHFFL
jgi:hypothetical protein